MLVPENVTAQVSAGTGLGGAALNKTSTGLQDAKSTTDCPQVPSKSGGNWGGNTIALPDTLPSFSPENARFAKFLEASSTRTRVAKRSARRPRSVGIPAAVLATDPLLLPGHGLHSTTTIIYWNTQVVLVVPLDEHCATICVTSWKRMEGEMLEVDDEDGNVSV